MQAAPPGRARRVGLRPGPRCGVSAPLRRRALADAAAQLRRPESAELIRLAVPDSLAMPDIRRAEIAVLLARVPVG